MNIIFGIVGVGLMYWSISAGMGTWQANRAAIFAGPIGPFLSFGIFILGLYLAISNFF